MKVAVVLIAVALILVGCGGGEEATSNPKLPGKVETVTVPDGSKSPTDKLRDAETQRDRQAAASAKGEDAGVSEGGH